MRTISPNLSTHFALMSFVCALLVVTIHASVAPRVDSWQFYAMQAIDRLNDIAVPYFFVAAGFFLAGSFEFPHWYKTAIGKRIKSLIIPFFAWLLIYQLFNIGLVVLAKYLHRPFGVETLNADWTGVLYLFGLHPFKLVPIVWFLRALFFLVLLSPVFAKLGRWMFTVFLVLAFGLYALHEQCLFGKERIWSFFEYFFSLRGLFFFACGIYIRRFLFNRFAVPHAVSCLIAFVAVALGLFPWGGVIAAFLLLWSVWWLVGFLPVSQNCAYVLHSYTMPIYLVHFLVIIVFGAIFSAMGLKSVYQTSLFVFGLKLLVAVSMTIAITHLLRRYFPAGVSLLMGGR